MRRWKRVGVALLLTWTVAAYAEPSAQELWGESLEAETGNDLAQALEIHERILPMVGKSYAAYLREGWLLYRMGDYKKALPFYEKASGISSGAISPLYGAMNCYVAMDNASKATRAAKAILVIDELNYTANLQLAALYYQDRKFSLSSSYYRKLNRLYPEDLAVTSGLAWSYLEQGQARKAEPLFKQILMVSPDYAYAKQGLETCQSLHSNGRRR
jgi:tetratricopeptide (TPR) repeat protein